MTTTTFILNVGNTAANILQVGLLNFDIVVVTHSRAGVYSTSKAVFALRET